MANGSKKTERGTETHLSQYVHLNGLCPLCVRLWIVSAPVIANDLPQSG